MIAICCGVTAAFGQSNGVEALLEKRGSLTLREISLSQALFTISETWEVNLLFGRDIDGQVNGVFRDVTLREVLDSLLLANGYGYQSRGQSIIVMPVDELGENNEMLRTASVPLPSGNAAGVSEAIEMLLSPQGRSQVVDSLGAVMVTDYPQNIKRVSEFVATLDQSRGLMPERLPPLDSVLSPLPAQSRAVPDSIAYLSPKHVSAESLQETLQSVIGEEARVILIATENRLAVIGKASTLDVATQVFEELDQPRPQVRITALIYDVNVSEVEKLGINWTHNARLGNAGQMFDGKFGVSPDPTLNAFTIGSLVDDAAETTASTLGAGRLTSLNKYLDLSAVVSALDQVTGARLLADPSVTVMDREEASIRIVTEVPIQQLTQTAEGGSIGTTDFREAGVTLTVTPNISSDDTVTMKVAPTFSVLSGFNDGQPIIDTREAMTTVRVKNGQTLVIGGLRQRSEIESVTGIPKLMRWKRLGKLFREHDTSIQESELIVFLRPEISLPETLGKDREAAGLCVAHKLLDRLNWPTEMPVVPCCGDPHCPYHNPRSRFVRPAYSEPAMDYSTFQEEFLPPAAVPPPPFEFPEIPASAEPGESAPEANENAENPPQLQSNDTAQSRWNRFVRTVSLSRPKTSSDEKADTTKVRHAVASTPEAMQPVDSEVRSAAPDWFGGGERSRVPDWMGERYLVPRD